ncbi:sigma 54-interacting transcriptional regulator [Tissierella sp. MB52-C2]|uniref:sigma-54-dependent transcriptional regulator n=1 Tax=Tissierella sp. MB52-C2 TaxID=3070999 RepID=UPI00280AE343|nr:sigma 54-interacting transcriptional regulator [Tissierella sp. MB52-C2]WMM25439.1 sigma 54-interacting transcriptional regulator [Tissierella sp. MB52-C2]
MRKIDEVYRTILKLQEESPAGISAMKIAQVINLDRSNVSRYLNRLYKENKLIKIDGRPVLYKTMSSEGLKEDMQEDNLNSLDKLVGAKQSLSIPIEKAKAAIIYPPRGLHSLILGNTGVGKSLFAEQMCEYAKEINILSLDSPFIRFNCADYADNPNLLTSQIFGVKKGAYTGADKDKDGLLKQANKGILFLDEVHRLPPQGQEMLFTYIDKGLYRPLGETENLIHVDVRIIAATTEKPSSYLLQTFSRRIPMVISLPDLSERTLSERYSLVETFVKEESHRIGKSIYINKNSIISFLLYNCPNNIGQLKSDIQLACAKAFLNYKANDQKYLIINQGDLPNHVRKGILNIKEYRKEIDELLSSADDILKYSKDDEPILQLVHEEEIVGEDFYSIIEEKIDSLKVLGMEDSDINEILNLDIESHFEKYIGEISKRFKKDEIQNIVDNQVLDITEEILMLAKTNLNKEFGEKIYFGLALHLERSIERIKKGDKIYNPKLNFIRINYEDEFLFAMKIAKLIDNRFNIEIPVDEIGYLSMFFTKELSQMEKEKIPQIGIIVAMHGRSTASSMAEVVNDLIGMEYIVPIDMPLSMKPENIYNIVKEKIKDIDKEEGIILMVDMGSLTNFGPMISEETGINIRTIDMVSTLSVLEVGRKAMMNYDIDEIINSTWNKSFTHNMKADVKDKKNIILTACYTGDGSARIIGNIINKRIKNKNIEVMHINIVDERSLQDRINEIKKDYNIWVIVSIVDCNIRDIPFIPALELFTRDGEEKLDNIIEYGELCNKISSSLEESLTNLKGDKIINDIRNTIIRLEEELRIRISTDIKIGLTLHICSLMDNLLSGIIPREFHGLVDFIEHNIEDMSIVRELFRDIEKEYKVKFRDDDIAYIVKPLKENGILCNSV